MTLGEYQTQTMLTAKYPQIDGEGIYYPIIGLGGEAGEVLNEFKKGLRDDGFIGAVRARAIALELGDVLWYLTVVAHELGYSLEDIMILNIEKLRERYENQNAQQ